MRRAAVLLAGAALALAACGDGDPPASERLVVSAAASLAEPLRACSRDFEPARVRLSFAGSDELAAQIRRGLRPALFLSADLSLPRALAREGLVDPPLPFASNELVVAAAPDAGIATVEDLAGPGVTVALAAPTVPAGAYARDALSRLDPALRRAILDRVRSEEPDVTGVVGKVAQGAVDAGFVYATDVAAAGDRLRAVALPASARPRVRYGVALVDGARPRAAALRFAKGLRSGACRRALDEAGFGSPEG